MSNGNISTNGAPTNISMPDTDLVVKSIRPIESIDISEDPNLQGAG